jgi:SAM-dependent methyltransferase
MTQSAENPGRILGMMTAFEQTAAIVAALRVGLFTAIAQGADTARDLSARIDCPERAVRMLADVLCVHGLLSKADGVYGLAPDAALFLDAGSPAYLGDAARFLASPQKLALCLDEPEVWMRRGGPADQAHTTPNAEAWVDFARGMAPMMAPTAERLAQVLKPEGARVRRVLDVAAGHGLFGVAVAKVMPQARITALDWAAVLQVAQQTALAAGVGDRFELLAGDGFTTPLGQGYDLILIPNFLHHFDRGTCVGFLERASKALALGGKVAIVEFVPNEDRVSPPGPALFVFSMLTATPSGDAYTEAELREMCAAAGLDDIAVQGLPPTTQTLVLAGRRALTDQL